MMAARYAHAKQFKRHHGQLRLLRTRLGILRDVRRKIAGRPEIEATFAGGRVHRQGQSQRALRVRGQGFDRHYNARAPGGQFVLHAKALPGNPYDGHTLGVRSARGWTRSST